VDSEAKPQRHLRDFRWAGLRSFDDAIPAFRNVAELGLLRGNTSGSEPEVLAAQSQCPCASQGTSDSPAPAGSSTNPAVVAALQDPTSVFDPQQVPLYPAPSAPIGPNWAAIHASVTRSGTTPAQGLPWAVLQVTRNSDSAVLATGQADASGEALLAVLGLSVQPNTSGTGPVTVSTVAVTVKAFFDPSVLSQPPSWIPNPDDTLSNLSNPALKSSSQPLQLGSGQELSMSFAISV
jgi:hypothetical protein